nr:hypothetical protein [Caldanaerobacter subterraneus]
MAEESAQAVEQIGNILKNIEGSVEIIVGEIDKTTQIAGLQAGSTQQIVSEIMQLEHTADNLRNVGQQLISLG